MRGKIQRRYRRKQEHVCTSLNSQPSISVLFAHCLAITNKTVSYTSRRRKLDDSVTLITEKKKIEHYFRMTGGKTDI